MLAIDLTKAWIDHAVLLGAQRVMINQGAQGGTTNVMPNNENKVYGIPTLKTMADYGKSKNIIVSMETRGAGGGGGASRRRRRQPRERQAAVRPRPTRPAAAARRPAPHLHLRHRRCHSRKSGR